MMGTTRSDPGFPPRGAGAADAAADLASHRSPSDASRDRGRRDLGRLAGVLPAGARSNFAYVASGPVGLRPGPVGSGPVGPGSGPCGSVRPGQCSGPGPVGLRPGPCGEPGERSGPGPVGPGSGPV